MAALLSSPRVRIAALAVLAHAIRIKESLQVLNVRQPSFAKQAYATVPAAAVGMVRACKGYYVVMCDLSSKQTLNGQYRKIIMGLIVVQLVVLLSFIGIVWTMTRISVEYVKLDFDKLKLYQLGFRIMAGLMILTSCLVTCTLLICGHLTRNKE